MDLKVFLHDDFEIIRKDDRFGGFEEVKLKEGEMSDVHFFRKSVTPFNTSEFDDMMQLQDCLMKEGCSGIIHPMYEHEGVKWVLMSVPHESYEATGLAPEK